MSITSTRDTLSRFHVAFRRTKPSGCNNWFNVAMVAFICITVIITRPGIPSKRSPDERSDIRGLYYRSPHIAVLMRATGWQRK
jgi:hypothetical protein